MRILHSSKNLANKCKVKVDITVLDKGFHLLALKQS